MTLNYQLKPMAEQRITGEPLYYPPGQAYKGWKTPGFMCVRSKDKPKVLNVGVRQSYATGHCDNFWTIDVPTVGLSGCSPTAGAFYNQAWTYGYFGPPHFLLQDKGVPLRKIERNYWAYEVKGKPGIASWSRGGRNASYGVGSGIVGLDYYHPGEPVFSTPVPGYSYVRPNFGVWDFYGDKLNSLTYDAAKASLEKALRSQYVADLGETLVEMISLRQMVKTLLKNVAKDLPAILKLMSNPARLTSKAANIEFLDAMASLQLAWSYMLRPLIETFNELVDNADKLSLSTRTERLERSVTADLMSIKTTGHHPTVNVTGTQFDPTNPPVGAVCYSGGNYSGGGKTTTVTSADGDSHQLTVATGASDWSATTHLKVDVNSRIDLKINKSAVFEQLGLNNPIKTAWEVFPISFIFDTIINVSGYLSNTAIEDGFVVEKHHATFTFHCLTLATCGSSVESRLIWREPSLSVTYVGSGSMRRYTYKCKTPWGNPITTLTDQKPIEMGAGIRLIDDERVDVVALLYLLTRGLSESLQAGELMFTRREARKYRTLGY